MRTKTRRIRHGGHKCETDRYELEWHEMLDSDGNYTVKKSVWAAPTLFGYDSNHIDSFDIRENRATIIRGENLRALDFKFSNTIKNSKFLP